MAYIDENGRVHRRPPATMGAPRILDDGRILRDRIPGSRRQFSGSRKSTTTALLLCFFLGGLGVHRFYCGKIGTGVLYLLTNGLVGIGAVVDMFRISYGKFSDSEGFCLAPSVGGKIVAWLLLLLYIGLIVFYLVAATRFNTFV